MKSIANSWLWNHSNRWQRFSKIEGTFSELHLRYPPENISNSRGDPITEEPKEEPKNNPLSWRPWGAPWKRLVELKADLAKQFHKKEYWDEKQILRQYENMA